MAPPRSYNPNRPAAGFTLIEALAALTLTAMLFAAALPLFVQFIGRWSAGTTRSMAADQWMSATTRIGDDLAQALPLALPQGGHRTIAFRGAPEQVDFVRTSLGANGHFQLETVSFVIVPHGNSVALERVARPFSSETFEAAPDVSAGVTLLRLRPTLKFIYMDAKGGQRADWGAQELLPRSVELVLDAFDARSMDLPALTFPIVASSP